MVNGMPPSRLIGGIAYRLLTDDAFIQTSRDTKSSNGPCYQDRISKV